MVVHSLKLGFWNDNENFPHRRHLIFDFRGTSFRSNFLCFKFSAQFNVSDVEIATLFFCLYVIYITLIITSAITDTYLNETIFDHLKYLLLSSVTRGDGGRTRNGRRSALVTYRRKGMKGDNAIRLIKAS